MKVNELPEQFNERVRPDIMKRAVLSIQSKNRQAYGSAPEAGLQHVTRWKKRNNAYRTQKGRGRARTPRKITFRRGTQLFGPGAEAPNTRGGRRAHGPKAEKDWDEEINNKERRKAIRSGIAASSDIELVSERHVYDGELPIVENIEDIDTTSELEEVLEDLGLEEELERASEKKVRAGRGTSRGRKYQRKVGPLLVVSEDKGVFQAAGNLPGVDIVRVENLNAELLAPGAQPGRLIVWSKGALEKLEEEKLFID